jgi:hypothetical protein
VQRRVAADIGQLLLPLLRLALPQIVGHAAREAVLVGAVDLGLDGDVLLLEPQHGPAVEPFLVVLALPQRPCDPVGDFRRDLRVR